MIEQRGEVKRIVTTRETPLGITLAMSLLVLLACVVGAAAWLRASDAGIAVVAGIAINVGLAILLYIVQRRWVVVVVVLRALLGAVLSGMQLSDLRERWGEWSMSYHGGAMVFLAMGLVLDVGVILALANGPTLRALDARRIDADV